jgi:hypothetical protein
MTLPKHWCLLDQGKSWGLSQKIKDSEQEKSIFQTSKMTSEPFNALKDSAEAFVLRLSK